MQTIKLPSRSIKLNRAQHIFIDPVNGLGNCKASLFLGGFGAGKTFIGGIANTLSILKSPNIVNGYFAPTYPLIEDVFYPTIEEIGVLLGLTVKIKISDKEVSIFDGRKYYGRIICRSFEDPSKIIGFKIKDAHIDELDVPPTKKGIETFRRVQSRQRLVVDGQINRTMVTSTPEGFKTAYELFSKNPKKGYGYVQAPTLLNAKNLPPNYIDDLKDSYPEEYVKSYLLGKFVNLTGGSVWNKFNRTTHHVDTVNDQDDFLIVGMDFNVNNMAAVVYVKRWGELHAVAEIDGARDTPHIIEILKERFPNNKISIYPDASGRATSSKSASQSDFDILRRAGFEIVVGSQNPRVRDRVVASNNAFEKMRVKVNTNTCKRFTECLEQHAYDKHGDPDKASGHDHMTDAGTYPIVKLFPTSDTVARRIEFNY